jgi:hypothetical protein
VIVDRSARRVRQNTATSAAGRINMDAVFIPDFRTVAALAVVTRASDRVSAFSSVRTKAFST